MITQDDSILRQRSVNKEARYAKVLPYSLVSWKTVFVGLFITVISYAILFMLGIGIGGYTITDTLQENGSFEALANRIAVWIGFSSMLSLAVGNYIAVKSSRQTLKWIGGVQGLLVASLFFVLMFLGTSQTVSLAGKGTGIVAGVVGISIGNLASNLSAQNAVENILSEIPLKSEPTEVIQGLLTRLLQGDTKSARQYLSLQTGMSKSELDTKYDKIESEVKLKLKEAGANAAEVVSSSAWKIFWILLFGTGVAVLTGVAGTKSNSKKVFSREKKVTKQKTTY